MSKVNLILQMSGQNLEDEETTFINHISYPHPSIALLLTYQINLE